MAEPRFIDADGRTVVVKLMDDSWIINECVGAHPHAPRPGVVWKHSDQCAQLPVPGDEFPAFMREMRDTYGNCAVIAWCGQTVLGHLVFLPRKVARAAHVRGWEHFGPPAQDEGTLVVANLAFCSLSGHEFRRKGVGKAMVDVMVEWARENRWQRVEVYDTGGGLFPNEWLDLCLPPRPFWEGRGFSVFQTRSGPAISEQTLQELLADNPRNNAQEQAAKEHLAQQVRAGLIDPAKLALKYDFRRELQE